MDDKSPARSAEVVSFLRVEGGECRERYRMRLCIWREIKGWRMPAAQAEFICNEMFRRRRYAARRV